MRGCFWGHGWGSWEVVEEGSLMRPENRDDWQSRKVRIGEFSRQRRVCIRCGYTQIDIQRVYYDPRDDAAARHLAHDR